jgi:O-acetyl-ADP-ribose deacetylase (regulator of RNase III)
MPPQSPEPTVEDLIDDLRVLRERGLVRLRHADLPHLRGAAAGSSVAAAAAGGPGAVEALLRVAVDNIGGGSLGAAATATFGLGRGAKDRPAQDRRRQAALVYGVSIERFRKHHERVVVEQVAEEILKLCMPPAQRLASVKAPELGAHIDLEADVRGTRVPVVVHIEPVEMLTGVDIIVAPANLYLEPAQQFKSSVSAAVRRAGAIRGTDGQILVDVLATELHAWSAKHGRIGLPTAPGTVAPTSSGEMAGQGVRRVYHVAVASPRPGSNDYDVDPTAIAQGVRNVLALARAERALFDPPLASIGFPLIGAGRGGLAPETSFSWLWAALERDLAENEPWRLHFITRRRAVADVIVAKLGEAGVVGEQPG